jgi:RNA polymerase sigma-70 factor (ECF subfamily)
MSDSDLAVVAAARRGDREAFRLLVERHSRFIYAVAYRITGNAEDAEDVVQDTWLKAHRQFGRFEARADVRTWLCRIGVNCAIDLIRSRRHREDAHDPADLERGFAGDLARDPTPAPDRLAASAELGERVTAALDRLTAIERAAFTLRHVEGMSIAEVGARLGLRTSAAKHSVFRAVKKMREALRPFAEPGEPVEPEEPVEPVNLP